MIGIVDRPDIKMFQQKRLIIVLFLAAATACAQAPCRWGSPEAADALEKALHDQKTCRSATELMEKCMGGSSADSEFAPIVIEKCEGDFLKKLSPAGMDNYTTQMQLCAYEFARQEGTISISEAAMCQVDVAARFAANPAANDHAPPKASFDCAKAQSILERAICSDIRLGHADIILARVYSNASKWVGHDKKAALVKSERIWLQALPSRCGLTAIPLAEKQVDCLRNQIEIRFSLLDGCGDGEDPGACLDSIDDPRSAEDIGSLEPSPRASFDCETPKTALEIVICADSELGQKDIQLTLAYRDADARMGAAQHQALVDSERQWLGFVSSNCPLGAVGGIPPIMARACVRSAFETRIAQLQSCMEERAAERMACLNDFNILPK